MMSYADGPHVLTWEITRACQLHCRHCRARAIPRRDPEELSLEAMIPVLDDLATNFAHPPILVLTGGDPLERPDLDDLIRAARERRLIVAVAPSATPRLTPEVVNRWHELGVHSVSLSLDGSDRLVHDAFRGSRGTFERTIAIAKAIVDAGVALQINTSISQQTIDELPEMAQLVRQLGVTSWELFFVIPTGRARLMDALSARQIEQVLEWLTDFADQQPFRVTTVGAPQYIRALHRRSPEAPLRTVAREARGFAFINHRGEVFPSGYLPVSAGNVKDQPFSEIYRQSELFQMLRDPDCFEGPCGVCHYREACGGSRARAYAVTGSLVASDPGCVWV